MTASGQRPAGNLPVSLTRFVGRHQEIAQARRLLASARLVTLTGVGGVGKTRLAIEVAGRLGREFPDGTWLADLSAVDDESQVPQAVANALGIVDRSTRPAVDKITAHLAGAAVLLVLDNCEHLGDSCAALVNRLLSQTRDVRVLATSRRPLGITGEHLLAVPPLPVPGPGAAAEPVAALSRYDAVTLLADRAAALQPGFAVTADNAAAVVRICAQLDGLPLAIELAASRLRSLSAGQLAGRLERRFAVLNRGSPVARPRQQTLRALFDWSYSLCTAAQRLLWARLSVFAGTFGLAAAEAVCAGPGLPAGSLLDELDQLVGQSIVLAEPHGQRMRYRLLETIRQYGRERLAETGEEQPLRQRHCDFYLGLARGLAAEWFGPRQEAGLRRLRDEHANLLAALETAAAGPGGRRPLLDFTVALRNHWYADGYLAEGRTWLDHALALPPEDGPPEDGPPEDGPPEENGPAGDVAASRVHALWVAAWVCLLQGDNQAARARLDDCEALAVSLGDQRALGFARSLRGTAYLFAGRVAEAIARFTDALEIFAGIGDNEGGGWAKFQLAISLSHHGDSAGAQAAGQAALRVCAAHGERLCRSYTLWVLAFDDWLAGRPQAADLARSALAIQRGFHDPVGTALIIELLAWIAASRDDSRGAAELLATADSVWSLIGTTITAFGPPLGTHRAGCQARVQAALGQPALAAAARQGRVATVAAAIASVLDEPPAAPAAPAARLTGREQEIAALVATGLSNRAIAARLVISQRTVDGHVERILAKLGFTSRAQIAAWAVTDGKS
jgi:predicted ATPase/DNA-binding CsgD family transcriptional regulator